VSVLSILLALVAASLFAVGTVFQQKGAMQETAEEALRAGFLVRLLRKPVWLFGVATDVCGYLAQAAALGVGKLVVVQPLLVVSLVFALPLGVKLTGQRVGRREITGAATVCAGLAVFMVVADPKGGRSDARPMQWVIAGIAVAVVAGALAALGIGRRPALKAALFGTSAGVLFGLVAALTKATVDRFDVGVLHVVADWHLYALLTASIAGFALSQISLQAGALAPALASTMVFETIIGVVVGIELLNEELHRSDWGNAVSAVALLAILSGVVLLAREPDVQRVS
jgi:drug/metabolite transporter (DMT)-like permease